VGRGPSLIKSVAINQRWRRKSTSIVYSVRQVWRKDRMVMMVPLANQGARERTMVTVADLRTKWEPIDMYIDPEVFKRERDEEAGETPEG
jgi:hypothetical protein